VECFTPFRIEDAQYATPSPLIAAHKVGVLNEKRCNMKQITLIYDEFFVTKHFSIIIVYTGEDLKPHPVGVLCFKSLPIPLI
jgi:hypothetical protein